MNKQLLRHVEERGIHQLIMDHGPNALDRPLMGALRAKLSDLSGDGAPALLLASAHPTVFCPGWDLKILVGADRGTVADFLAEFNALILDLFSYQGPTAAVLGGHAVAGGCLLAHACDLRVMATGKARVGLSELNLGVPVPGDSLRMLRARLSSAAVDHLVFRGDGFTAERAREFGIIHRTAPPDDVVTATQIELGKLAGRPRRAFTVTKGLLLGEVWREMAEPSPDDDDAFLECWFDTHTQERIRGVADRLGQ
jgi:enoyl-CoA hydratase